MFKPVSSQLNVTRLEDDVLRFWRLYQIFARSKELRREAPEFVFYEGPPTANGKPGVHLSGLAERAASLTHTRGRAIAFLVIQ